MSTLLSSWKQFQLFDFTPIRDPNYQTADALYSDPTLSAITATKSNYLIIAINNSSLKIVNAKDLTTLGTFMIYDVDYRITFLSPLNNSNNLIISLAEKQGSPSIIKLWDINKLLELQGEVDEIDFQYKFQTQVSVSNGDNSFPISCFKFTFDLTCLALGYTNGKVILVRGDLLRDRGAKQRVIYESNDPITGIQFNEKEMVLYITTTSKILTVSTTGRNQGKPTQVLSSKTGVDLNCTDIDTESQDLIVGLPGAIRYYNHINKLSTINFDTPKSKIMKFESQSSSKSSFLLIVSPQHEDTTTKTLMTRIIILDLVNMYISFNILIPSTLINYVFLLQGDLYLLSADGVLYKLHEKPINQQIELILQRELFQVAFNLAKQSKSSTEVLLRIKKLHGEHLYDAQNYEESAEVFTKCLELFDNKQVGNDDEEDLDDFVMNIITKFKEATNIANLTKFLTRLHEMGIANIDHVTLLLCCFCKLKQVENIDKFIDELDVSMNFQDLNFQLIINLFKECGYFQQVIKLLYKLNQPNLIVDIQLYDLKKPKLALSYIKTLTIDELLLILIDHSKSLLDSCPIETTELLINVFTGKYLPHESQEPLVIDKEETQEASMKLTNYQAFVNYLSGSSEEEPEQKSNEPTYLPPRPSLIYSSFTGHPNEFVIFLEACIETFDRFQGNIADKKETLLTLLEMYLSIHQASDDKEWLTKAESVVTQYGEILDNKSLLLLSHLYDFKHGEVIAKENSQMQESLLTSYQIAEDVDGCFEILKKFGDTKPELYKSMLRFLISKKSIFEKVNIKDFQYILDRINFFKLMNPLEILQVLTEQPENDYITLGLVKEYFMDYFKQKNKEIINNEKLIEMYEQESTKSSYKLSELTKPFVIQNNKCSMCELKLDFPVIHFKCRHSFHQKCLSTNLIMNEDGFDGKNETPQCPVCIGHANEIRNVKASQFKSKENYEVFLSLLHESKDKFKFIADYFGKGVMENESITMLND
ncbi:vps11 [[Candida] subhashii]|uniref:E3 ubiquitin-protein ligase PEP5 n=1 Tax=[Candida] subhashii TaxID=561895 RepID=A0A8J5QR61_9ASCO|nr:vps11 [[Candida] subhashii]KAG7665100.1 vps11 [[Candida] subhashii]